MVRRMHYTLHKRLWSTSALAIFASLATAASCSDSTADFAQADTQWMSALGKVEVGPSSEEQRIGQGDCRTGTVAGLHVDLCQFKDALSADAAREAGLAKIGSDTGAAIVRKRTLLVVSDPDKVDVHGKLINQLTKSFANPPPVPAAALSNP